MPAMDILSDSGMGLLAKTYVSENPFVCGLLHVVQQSSTFRLALCVLLRLRPRSLVVLAPVCSTMGTIAAGHTRRSFVLPIGDTSRQDVSQANKMSLRVLILVWVCSALGHKWIIEQPASGVWRHLPWWRFFVKYVQITYRQGVWMKHFGTASMKRTYLWSNCAEVHNLDLGPLSKAGTL